MPYTPYFVTNEKYTAREAAMIANRMGFAVASPVMSAVPTISEFIGLGTQVYVAGHSKVTLPSTDLVLQDNTITPSQNNQKRLQVLLEPSDLVATSAAQSPFGLCSGIPYMTALSVCCNGLLLNNQVHACCGPIFYNINTEGCCNGIPYDLSTHYCCEIGVICPFNSPFCCRFY